MHCLPEKLFPREISEKIRDEGIGPRYQPFNQLKTLGDRRISEGWALSYSDIQQIRSGEGPLFDQKIVKKTGAPRLKTDATVPLQL